MIKPSLQEMEVVGYFPGAIGQITACHAFYYYKNWGFDVTFETQVSKELSEFMLSFKQGRDGLWVLKIGETFIGSIAIDGSKTQDQGARLRWFIVCPEYHGLDIGKLLIEKAVRFCKEANHKKVFLWTFEGLNAARALYERHGFKLAEEHKVNQWGQIINEQLFELEF
jgi:GNAT superfamily N-acetyltransferase